MCLHPRIPKMDTTKGHLKVTQKVLCNVCEMRVMWDLHEFPATVVTVSPRRGEVGLEATQVCFLTVLESGIQNQLVSRVGHFQGSEGSQLRASPSSSLVVPACCSVPWLVTSSLLPHPGSSYGPLPMFAHHLPSGHISVQTCSPHKDTGHMGLRAHPDDLILTNYICNHPVCKSSPSSGSEGRTSVCLSGEINP